MKGLSRRSIARVLVASLVALAAVFAPFSAMAQEAAGPWDAIDLSLIQSNGQAVLLVSGTLPPDAKLPANVSLAMPKGGEVTWAGEIVGADPSQDPTVEYKVQQGDEYDLVEFTMSRSRRAQIEVEVPEALTKDGAATTAAIEWVAPYGIPTVKMALQLPPGSQITSASADTSTSASSSATFVTQDVTDVTTGDTLALAATYQAGQPGGPGGQAGEATGGGTTGGALGGTDRIVLAILAIAVVVGIVFYLVRRQQQPAEEDAEGEEEELESAEEPEEELEESEEEPREFDAFDEEDEEQ